MKKNQIQCPNCQEKYEVEQKQNGQLYISKHIPKKTDYNNNPIWNKKQQKNNMNTMLSVVVIGILILTGTNPGRQFLNKVFGIPLNTFGVHDETNTLPTQIHDQPVQEQILPPNGIINMFTSEERLAPFTVTAPTNNNYLIKMENATTKKTSMYIFVKAGTTATTKIPLGTYRMKIAYGQKWYGITKLFGEQTQYGIIKQTLPFTTQIKNNKKYYMGQIIKLKAINGNLTTKRISKIEF